VLKEVRLCGRDKWLAPMMEAIRDFMIKYPEQEEFVLRDILKISPFGGVRSAIAHPCRLGKRKEIPTLSLYSLATRLSNSIGLSAPQSLV
jgi:hypothetical protein